MDTWVGLIQVDIESDDVFLPKFPAKVVYPLLLYPYFSNFETKEKTSSLLPAKGSFEALRNPFGGTPDPIEKNAVF